MFYLVTTGLWGIWLYFIRYYREAPVRCSCILDRGKEGGKRFQGEMDTGGRHVAPRKLAYQIGLARSGTHSGSRGQRETESQETDEITTMNQA